MTQDISEAVVEQADPVEALALELAIEWHGTDRELESACGTTLYDKTPEDFLEEAREHIELCAKAWNARAALEASGVQELVWALTFYAQDVNAALDDDRDEEGYGRRARAALALHRGDQP